MIYELRTYDLRIGKLPGYLRLFETTGFEILTRYATPVGYWFAETGPLNRIHHMWAYADRTERAEKRAALYADKDWLKDFIPYALPHLERQANAVFTLAEGSPDPLAHARAGAAEGRWLYEFVDLVAAAPAPDAATVGVFRAASGDLARRLAVRAYPDEAAFGAASPGFGAPGAVSETYHPAPFSALR